MEPTEGVFAKIHKTLLKLFQCGSGSQQDNPVSPQLGGQRKGSVGNNTDGTTPGNDVALSPMICF